MPSKKPNRRCACGCGRPGRYLARLEVDGEAHFLGYFATKAERTAARERRRRELREEISQAARPKAETITCAAWADRWLEKRERDGGKASSLSTARQALKPWRAEFGSRPIGSIDDVEAEDWVTTVSPTYVQPVVTLMNYAVRRGVLSHNPFAGLVKRGRGRADDAPPTVREFGALLDACDVLGDYAPQMRALLIFGAYTGMRPSELYALRWADIDLARNRITVSQRLYRGVLDVPKNGRPKVIALPPPARDVLLEQPTRAADLVFLSKTGSQLTAPVVCGYWRRVRDRAGLEFDFYHATKHYGVHLLWKQGLSKRAIAAQMGWSERAVDSLLRVYGHADLVALEEIDALYADGASLATGGRVVGASPTGDA
jgi:integrase